jgi:hypothetical protein
MGASLASHPEYGGSYDDRTSNSNGVLLKYMYGFTLSSVAYMFKRDPAPPLFGVRGRSISIAELLLNYANGTVTSVDTKHWKQTHPKIIRLQGGRRNERGS